jgi:hypothetical protein
MIDAHRWGEKLDWNDKVLSWFYFAENRSGGLVLVHCTSNWQHVENESSGLVNCTGNCPHIENESKWVCTFYWYNAARKKWIKWLRGFVVRKAISVFITKLRLNNSLFAGLEEHRLLPICTLYTFSPVFRKQREKEKRTASKANWITVYV